MHVALIPSHSLLGTRMLVSFPGFGARRENFTCPGRPVSDGGVRCRKVDFLSERGQLKIRNH